VTSIGCVTAARAHVRWICLTLATCRRGAAAGWRVSPRLLRPPQGLQQRVGCYQSLRHRSDRRQNSRSERLCLPCFKCQRSSTVQAAHTRQKKRAMNPQLLQEALTVLCLVLRSWHSFCPESAMRAHCPPCCDSLELQQVYSLQLEERCLRLMTYDSQVRQQPLMLHERGISACCSCAGLRP
jgi:hypothetical protein